MNSRERVLETIKCKPADRVSYDYQAEDVTLEKIYRHTGQRNFAEMLDQLDVDIRHIDAIHPLEKKLNLYYQNYWGRTIYIQAFRIRPNS